MITAAERLLEKGVRDFGLLFVVGEERNSAGAHYAAQHSRGSKYIINGEPTENHLALGSKGALRYEVVARGKMAHSAYPELGDSAIHKLLDALDAIRKVELPVDEVLGAEHAEHRHHSRRARTERHSRRSAGGDLHPPRGRFGRHPQGARRSSRRQS